MSLTFYSRNVQVKLEEYIVYIIEFLEYVLKDVIIPTAEYVAEDFIIPTTQVTYEKVIEVKHVVKSYIFPSTLIWYVQVILFCVCSVMLLPRALESVLMCVKIYKEIRG